MSRDAFEDRHELPQYCVYSTNTNAYIWKPFDDSLIKAHPHNALWLAWQNGAAWQAARNAAPASDLLHDRTKWRVGDYVADNQCIYVIAGVKGLKLLVNRIDDDYLFLVPSDELHFHSRPV